MSNSEWLTCLLVLLREPPARLLTTGNEEVHFIGRAFTQFGIPCQESTRCSTKISAVVITYKATVWLFHDLVNFGRLTMALPHSAMEKQLAQLMSTIWESERTLDAMYRRAMNLEKLLHASSGSTRTTISTLPVEVLGMVFREVVAQYTCVDSEYRPSPFEPDKPEWPTFRPELLLSHVSKFWRTVAIGTPWLWTHIRLYVKQSADLVDLYLARSRGLPLVLAFRQHFVCGIHPRQAYATEYPRVAATILNHMHVCRRLEIRTNVHVPELLDGLSCGRAPLLEEIILHHPRGTGEPSFSSCSFPILNHVDLGELISISATLPIQNITSLTLTGLPALGLPATTFIDLLSGLCSLSSLVLVDEVVDFHRSYTTDVAKMPSLRSWLLKPGPDISRIYLTELVEKVIAPALEELTLDFTNVSSPREIQLFLRYLKRGAPRFLSLRRITINSPFEGFDIITAFAHSAPNIEELSLSRYSVDSILIYLAHDARREAFPKLRTVVFDTPHFDWDVLLSFLNRRKLFGMPLHSLTFKGFGDSKGSALNGLFQSLLETCLTI